MPTPILRAIPDGTYYAFWSEGRRSQRKSMGTKSRAEAEARFAQWLLIRNAVVQISTSDLTVAECWAVYEKKHIEKNVASPDTLKHAWAKLAPHFGHLPVGAVDQDVVDDYVEAREAAVKSSTIRRELSSLIAAVNFCAHPAQKLAVSPLPKLVLPAEGEPRDRWLTTGEMQKLLTAAAEMRRGPRLSRGERFLWLALGTAGRKSAILDLTWDRVDFETGVIHLDVPGRAKTKKRRASVPISKELLPVLERAFAEREGDLVMDSKAEVWATVQWIAIKAGFGGKRAPVKHSQKPKATGISPHVLRHTAATHMARRGVPLFHIAKVLGNTVSMVERVYAKHAVSDLAGAVNIVSNGLEAAA